MRILSASDAISPALARTRLVLFTPFRWGRSWKLAATAYLSFAGTLFLPFMLLYMGFALIVERSAGHHWAAIIVAGSLLLTALYTFFFQLCSRLQFAFFDIVLNRGEFVAPAWRKYGAVSRPWTLLKVGIGTLALGLAVACFYPMVRHFIALLARMPADMQHGGADQVPPVQFFAAMAVFYGLYFGAMSLLGIYFLLASTASAFMVPSMALEGLSPRIAFDRTLAFIRQQTGAFFGFVGIRLGLGIAGYLGLTIVYEIVLVIATVLLGLLCWGIGSLLHALGVPMMALWVLGGIVLAVFFLGVNSYAVFLMVGAYFTFFEAHTLYFLGGRYPLLGDLLDRSTPPPPYIPPPAGYGWPVQVAVPPVPPPV